MRLKGILHLQCRDGPYAEFALKFVCLFGKPRNRAIVSFRHRIVIIIIIIIIVCRRLFTGSYRTLLPIKYDSKTVWRTHIFAPHKHNNNTSRSVFGFYANNVHARKHLRAAGTPTITEPPEQRKRLGAHFVAPISIRLCVHVHVRFVDCPPLPVCVRVTCRCARPPPWSRSFAC